MSDKILFKDTMYIIKANQKKNWYIGIANPYNISNSNLHCAQNEEKFSIHFKSMSDAEEFLEKYFKIHKIPENNKKFYKIYATNASEYNIDTKISLYDTTCYFSKDALREYRKNYNLYDTKNAYR